MMYVDTHFSVFCWSLTSLELGATMIILTWPRKQVLSSQIMDVVQSLKRYHIWISVKWSLMHNMWHHVLLLYVHILFLGQKALADAGVPYSAIEQACVGYVYGKLFLLLFTFGMISTEIWSTNFYITILHIFSLHSSYILYPTYFKYTHFK